MSKAIWWIRRDLRLTDNAALAEAGKCSDEVLPLFILDDNLIRNSRASKRRNHFLYAGLKSLDEALKRKGSQLVVRRGTPESIFAHLKTEIDFDFIFAEEDYSPYAKQRDEIIEKNQPLRIVKKTRAIHPEFIVNKSGEPYKVYTPYMKRWKMAYPALKPSAIKPPEDILTPDNLSSGLIPDYERNEIIDFPVGEAQARMRLMAFVAGEAASIFEYGDLRDLPAFSGTSMLSPFLKFGVLSVRQVFDEAYKALHKAKDGTERGSVEKWIDELIWREFYQYILYHFPKTRHANFRSKYDGLLWSNDPKDIEAWKKGATGFPFVDAGMRQLNSTGWMHNRLRMIVASFLVKNLLVDWRIGEEYFMQQLIDGDTASNVGGWQWVAGTGTDAAPYFRIFNPVTQGNKFDPDGDYIRQWIPELSCVPTKYIHTPWQLTAGEQQAVGCIIGRDYPERIVDLKTSRERALARYKV